jgi:hypothetical protein
MTVTSKPDVLTLIIPRIMLASNVNVKRAGKVSVARDGQMDGIA